MKSIAEDMLADWIKSIAENEKWASGVMAQITADVARRCEMTTPIGGTTYETDAHGGIAGSDDPACYNYYLE